MNSTNNETVSTPAKLICENFAELISVATIQFLSFLANLVAAIAIWKLPGLEENRCHLVVRTLVVSDLLIPLSTLPFSIISYANCAWTGGKILCSITAFISTTFLSWSFLIVFVMCLLRFLAVTRPLYYRNQVTCAKVQKALILGLIWPCLHLILPATGFGKFRLYERGLFCALDLTPEEPRGKILLYATVIEGGLVTVALLYFCTTILFSIKKKRRMSSLLSEQQQRGAGIPKVNKQQGGFARLTFVIVVLFCVCYVPFLSYRVFILIRGPSSYSDTTYFYSELLAHVNPLLNPLVYVLCNKQYRASIKELFAKCSCKNRCYRYGEKFYLKDEYGRSIELRKMSAFSTRTQSIFLE